MTPELGIFIPLLSEMAGGAALSVVQCGGTITLRVKAQQARNCDNQVTADASQLLRHPRVQCSTSHPPQQKPATEAPVVFP